jgi:hypothetical protein
MNKRRLLGAAFSVGLGLAATSITTDVDAQPNRGKKEASAPAGQAVVPTAKKQIQLTPPGISWGMSPKQVATVIDKVLDAAYRPLYQKTSPGVKMKALDAQLAEEKDEFRRSRIDFGKLPTGIDATPLKGEYTYMNKESLMIFNRDGVKRHFFFIQDKLWKIIEDRPLGADKPDGKDYQAAVIKLATELGVPGRVSPPDFDNGRFVTEVDWKDAATHLRAIERVGTTIAIAFEDLIILDNLSTLRPNKPSDADAIDPAVAAAVRKDDAPSAPPPPAEKPSKKK